MSLLLDSDSEEDNQPVNRLTVNQKFARQFEERERTKELERAKYLELDEDDDDDESVEEDDNAELLTTQLDLQVIKTINSLRKKDPKIYDKSSKWFDHVSDDDEQSESDSDNHNKVDEHSNNEIKSKKKRYKDIIRDQILEDMAEDDDANDTNNKITKTRNDKIKTKSKKKETGVKLSYNDEQEMIRKQFLSSFDSSSTNKHDKGHNSDPDDNDTDNDDGDVLFKVKSKTPEELAQDEIELQQALDEMNRLKGHNSDHSAENFLTEYMTNKKWLDKTIYTSGHNSDPDSDDDEAELDKMDRFESKYNFRFEELQDEEQDAGGDTSNNTNNNRSSGSKGGRDGNIATSSSSSLYQVQGHARNVQGSVRRYIIIHYTTIL